MCSGCSGCSGGVCSGLVGLMYVIGSDAVVGGDVSSAGNASDV